jgi:gamma-glutamyltranspeptidase/glutathione hydrolase
MMAGILASFEPASQPFGKLRFHRQIEAARLAFRDRDALVGDPLFSKVPVSKLLEPDYLAGLASLIQDDARLERLPAAGESVLPFHRDTVYLCVVDRDGNSCSLINSLFDDFGGGLYVDELGIVLHNRGSGFQVSRGHPNCIGPGKRPLHTILPALLTRRGSPLMTFGVTGGHFQPTGQVSFLNNIFDYGLNIQASLDAPRAYPIAGQVLAEHGVPDATFAGLCDLGHDIVRTRRPLGGGQAILIDRARGVLTGGSDPRRDGFAAGY